MADGFLGRWSRRKQDVRTGRTPAEPLPTPTPTPATLDTAAPNAAGPSPSVEPTEPAQPAQPLSLADAQALTIDSDFSPFTARGVASEIKNAALKTLFSDPHFNTMDGLDIYIGDYTQSTPLPLSILRQMASAKLLGLVPDEPPTADSDTGSAHGGYDSNVPVLADGDPPHAPAPTPDVAQSGVCNEPTSPLACPALVPADQDRDPPACHTLDDHADLRLQPNHAPPAASAGFGTG